MCGVPHRCKLSVFCEDFGREIVVMFHGGGPLLVGPLCRFYGSGPLLIGTLRRLHGGSPFYVRSVCLYDLLFSVSALLHLSH